MKSFKKAFTLIELVVVIAVIAVLSAVSVISYVSITNKAKESSDQQIIDQTNVLLQALEIRSGKQNTLHETIKSIEEDGFNVQSFNATAKGHTFAYAMEENRFVVLKNNQVIYPNNLLNAKSAENLWVFKDEVGEFNDSHSYYLRGSELTGEITTDGGIDVGENSSLTSITYQTDVTKNVIIRTSGGNLIIDNDGTDGSITHYGYLAQADITTDKNSFHTFGKIAKTELKKGKVVSESGAMVVLVKAAAGTEVAKVNDSIVYIPDGTLVSNKGINWTSETDLAQFEALGYSVVSSKTQALEETKASNVYEISNVQELIEFRTMVNYAGWSYPDLTVKLTNNIDLSGISWVPIGWATSDLNYSFEGIFDGNGFTISGLTNLGMDFDDCYFTNEKANTLHIYGLFGLMSGNATIKDLTLQNFNIEFSSEKESNGIGTLIGGVNCVKSHRGKNIDLNIINVSIVDCIVRAGNYVSGLIGRACTYGINKDSAGNTTHQNINISGCLIKATINANSTVANTSYSSGLCGLWGIGKESENGTQSLLCENTIIYCSISSTGSKRNCATGVVGNINASSCTHTNLSGIVFDSGTTISSSGGTKNTAMNFYSGSDVNVILPDGQSNHSL